MHSFGFSLVASVLTLVASQTINPTSVPLSTRQTWCTDQEAACPLICLQIPGAAGDPQANTCTADDLSYSCVCSNGISPNASQYSQTIPYFECTTYNQQCVNTCAQGDSACATSCQTAHPCGAQNPVRVNISTSATSTMAATAAATGTGTAQFTTGLGGSPASTSAPSSGTGSAASTIVIGFGRAYGLGLIFAGILAGFTLFL